MPFTKLISAISSMISRFRPRRSKQDLQDQVETWKNRAEVAKLAAIEKPEQRERFEALMQSALLHKERCETALSELESRESSTASDKPSRT